jgi:CTP:molybdopterin cytidylyltransferase MocA
VAVVTTAGILLAAGGGSRFDGVDHKLLAPFRGRPLLSWAIDSVTGAGFDVVGVVTGAVDLHAVLGPEIAVIENSDWASGQASSLQAARNWAVEQGHEAIVIGLGDQPLVPTSAWIAVGAARETPIAVASFDGARRPPVRLAAEVWPLLPTDGDEGARVLMAARPDLVVAVPCVGEPADVDTVEDLARWNNGSP